MDHLSAWINNNQLLDRIDSKEFNSLQDIIIGDVFGGFDKMLKCLMKNHKQLSLGTHCKLYNVLLTKHDSDIYDNYKSYTSTNSKQSKSLCIADVSDDCLTYIMKFLADPDLFSIQRTCRLFAIISRNETIFGDEYFQSDLRDPFADDPRIMNYNITPNKTGIVTGLLSDNIEAKQKSMRQLVQMTKHIDTHSYFDITKNYSTTLTNKLRNEITENILIDLTTNYMTLFLFELRHNPNCHWFDLTSKVFDNKLSNNDSIVSNDDISKIFKALSSICQQHIFDVMKCKPLIISMMDILQNHEKYENNEQKQSVHRHSSMFGDSDDDDDIFNPKSGGKDYKLLTPGLQMIQTILKCNYDIHKTTFFEAGIMSLLTQNSNANNGWLRARVLNALVTNITEDNIDIILNDDELLKSTLLLIKENNSHIVIKIFENSNYKQREKLVNKMIEIKMFTEGTSYVGLRIFDIMNEDYQCGLSAKFKSFFGSVLKKKKKKRRAIFDSSDDDDDFFAPVRPKPKKKAVDPFDDSSDESFDIKPKKPKKKAIIFDDNSETDESFDIEPKKAPKKAATNIFGDSDEDIFAPPPKPKHKVDSDKGEMSKLGIKIDVTKLRPALTVAQIKERKAAQKNTMISPSNRYKPQNKTQNKSIFDDDLDSLFD